MRAQRIIKKYPNRRLYDCAESRYVTLADVRKLVRKRLEFKVIDAASKTDITSNVLLQALVEQQEAGRRILSRDFLLRALRRS